MFGLHNYFLSRGINNNQHKLKYSTELIELSMNKMYAVSIPVGDAIFL